MPHVLLRRVPAPAIRSPSKFEPELAPDVRITTASAYRRTHIANSFAKSRLSAQQALTPKILFELMESRTEDSITVVETLMPETTLPAAAARPGQPGGSSRREQQQRDTPDPVSAAFTRARLC